MYDFNLLFNIIDELNKVFHSSNPLNINFDTEKQKKANILLHSYASEIGLYKQTKNTEKENINLGLTLIDKKTNKKDVLIDIQSMFDRVEEALLTDEYASCINALAISNKCAHGLDDQISSFSSQFVNMYKEYTGKDLKEVSFMKKFSDTCPDIKKVKKEYLNIIKNIITTKDKNTGELRYITNTEFNKIYKELNPSKKELHIGQIKRILNNLKIEFKDDIDANEKYTSLVQNRDKLKEAYLFHRYCIGKSLVALKDEMFAIKCNYISLIGQMIQKNRFGKIKCELVNEPSGEEGFKHMLIIDKPDLSYYVEVHMPDYLKHEFVKKYGFKVVERSMMPLGASAIYKRDKSEVKKIKKALKKGLINEDSNENHRATSRATIISRGNDELSELDEFEELKKSNKFFEFKSKKIKRKPISSLVEFLKSHDIHRYDDTLRFSDNLIHNESYSIKITSSIASNYHYNIYLSLDKKEKEMFIYESLYKYIQDNDSLDNDIIDVLKELLNNNVDIDIIAKIIIYKEVLKRIYQDEVKNKVKYNIKEYIYDLVNEYIEKDNDHGRKR